MSNPFAPSLPGLPNIQQGATLPTQGIGGNISSAIAGFIQAKVLKDKLDQQAQEFAMQQAQARADIEAKNAQAKLLGIETDKGKAELKKLDEEQKQHEQDQETARLALAHVNAYLGTTKDPYNPQVATAYAADPNNKFESPEVAQAFSTIVHAHAVQAGQMGEARGQIAEGDTKVARAPGDQMLAQARDTLMAKDPQFRRLSVLASTGVLGAYMQQDQQEFTTRTGNREEAIAARTAAREAGRMVHDQLIQDQAMVMDYKRSRNMAMMAGPKALEQFDAENPPVTQLSLDRQHAVQAGVSTAEYRRQQKALVQKALMATPSLSPEDKKRVTDAVTIIKSKKGTLQQLLAEPAWAARPDLTAEVQSQLDPTSP